VRLKGVTLIYNLVAYTDLVEILSGKIVGFAIYLGVVMILFILLFLKGRKASKTNTSKLNFQKRV
jgi:hypothetical protein